MSISPGLVPANTVGLEAVFEAHFLELSSRSSLPVTVAAYAGLRGRTISADHLLVQNASTYPTHWAEIVKSGGVLWMHFDGTLSGYAGQDLP